MDERVRIFLAEAMGTAILVVGGCGTAVFASSSNFVGILGVATAFGISLLILVYAIGGISGCHVNPAVTLGLWVSGKLESSMLVVYWPAQLIGGLLGGLVLWLTFKLSDKALPPGFASNGYGLHSPALFRLGSVMLIEIIMTALLVLAVLATTHSKFPVGFAGLAIGGTLWLIHLISIPISNTSVNPARSLGVAVYAAESWPKTQLWAFFVFPLIGGAVGALVWRLIGSEEEQATEPAPAPFEQT
jgi:aquaporin Z